jgi:predicted ATPase
MKRKMERIRESLYIKNLGPVKEVMLEDITPMTVLIGKSGCGKSTVMKVLSICRWVNKMVYLRQYLQMGNIKESPFKFDFRSYFKTSSVPLSADTLIKYEFDGTMILFDEGGLRINYSESGFLSLEKICFITEKRNMISDLVSLRANRKDAGFYLNEILDDFVLAMRNYETIDLDYLGVRLRHTNSKGADAYHVVGIGEENEQFDIRLNEASSGIQTVLPLVAVMSYYTDKFDIVKRFNQSIFRMLSETDSLKDFRPQMNIGEIPHRRVNFLIEEPELSLDPESQTHLIDFMVSRCLSKKSDGLSDYTVMLATHSPYIVNYLNLLIARSKKGLDGGVSYNDVNAYYMDKGRCYTLRIGDGHDIIDASSMSTTISNIYAEYNYLSDGAVAEK